MTELDGIAVIGTQTPGRGATKQGKASDEGPVEAARRARVHAVALTRTLATHHASCGPCQRGGRVVAARGGVRRERCEEERRLLAELGAAQDEGWPV